MIETKEAGVEPARHTCVRLTGFEVRRPLWNQWLKAHFVALIAMFSAVCSPKRVPLPYDILPGGICIRNAEGYRRLKAKLADPNFQRSVRRLTTGGAA